MPNNCRKHHAAGYHDQNTSNLYNRTTYIVYHNRTATSRRNLIIHKHRSHLAARLSRRLSRPNTTPIQSGNLNCLTQPNDGEPRRLISLPEKRFRITGFSLLIIAMGAPRSIEGKFKLLYLSFYIPDRGFPVPNLSSYFTGFYKS